MPVTAGTAGTDGAGADGAAGPVPGVVPLGSTVGFATVPPAGDGGGLVGRGGAKNENHRITTIPDRTAASSTRFSIYRPPLRAGTGSYPPGFQGWHRANRLTPSHMPRRKPWTATASRMYSEQVGANRHAGGRSGESHRL